MEEQSLKVFATRLPKDWTDEQVKEYFTAQGPVLNVQLFKHNSKSLGCAHITFKSKAKAEEIIEKLTSDLSTASKIQIRWADGEAERLKPRQPLPASKFVQYLAIDGRPYYLNTQTGLTQWEQPENWKISKPVQNQGPAGCNLFLFHLPIEWKESDLTNYFSPFGEVVSARIMCDKGSGRSKGFGFISFSNVNSAKNAVRVMNGFQVLGKRLKVEIKKGEYPEYVKYPEYRYKVL